MKTITKENEPDVNKEDQMYINEFSRLHTKQKIMDNEIKKINEILESLSDADQSVSENFGDIKIKLNIGECFVETNEDSAKEYVEKQQAKYQKQKKEIIVNYDKNKKRIDELKVILYAKFGKRLNLEEE